MSNAADNFCLKELTTSHILRIREQMVTARNLTAYGKLISWYGEIITACDAELKKRAS